MKALLLHSTQSLNENQTPLHLSDFPEPVPKPDEVLIEVKTCGVCHTELDEIEGRTPPSSFPIILGHQVVGEVVSTGEHCRRYQIGTRVGVGWIHSACGECDLCLSGRENLCRKFQATGRDVHGGYAEYMTVKEEFAHKIPESFSNAEAAPLLCAGAIGYRSLNLCQLKDGQRLGLTGFGASGHLVLKLTQHLFPKTKIYVFARNPAERMFAQDLGAVWSGDTTEQCPIPLHAIIDTTPAWLPILESLQNLAPGGRLVINAIRKEDGDKDRLAQIDYVRHLWMEKEIKSVANVTRQDITSFLTLAEQASLKPKTQEYPFETANQALVDLKKRSIKGAKVLKIR